MVYTHNMDDTTCLCTKLRRASRSITRAYDAAMAPVGVNITQFAQLRAIGRLEARTPDGHLEEAPTIGELAASIGLDRSTLGRNIRVMVRQGLADLGPGADERTRIVSLTDAGLRALKEGTALWQGVQEQVGDKLGAARRAELFNILTRIEQLSD